jgi:capsular polysaccharide biosynthesis protein
LGSEVGQSNVLQGGIKVEQELDLRGLTNIIRKRFVWLIVIPFIAVLIGGLFTYFFIPPIYESSTTLLVSRALDQSQLSYDEVMINRQLVPTFSELARSRVVTESVIKALHLDMTVAELAQQINISAIQNTEIIAVTVRNSDPYRAKQIVEQVSESFSEKIIGLFDISTVIVVDNAVLPEEPIGPNIKKNMAIAGVLGVMLALGIIFILETLDNTVKTQEDIEQLLGLPVVAVVPFSDTSRGGK